VKVTDPNGMLCEKKADVKLTDSEGGTVWACLPTPRRYL
jgi:hypothetical protein